IPKDKAKDLIPLFREIRMLANSQPGYITGETLKSMDNPEKFMVISTWQSASDWKNWLTSSQRRDIQSRIDVLLGGETDYEVFHYGFTA
ncbi:MAG: antibiotic biosynthesis monooxygenase, partial [Deltaproteobacteria bacterium]|nr:antibiotic biosynthesis monooxygenase [Deltaproteobacteria bacterium]